LVGLALTSATAVSALDPSEILLIRKGPLALKPQFELTETYDDNITYREVDKEADFKTVISPGFSLQLGDPAFNYIDFTYFYDRVEYLDLTELSANQHRAALVSRLEKRRFQLDGRDEFKRLVSPLGGGISIGGIQVQRDTWDDLYRLGYDLTDKTAMYVQAAHTSVNYESGVRLYDSFNLAGTVGFEFKALPKTSFFGEVYTGLTENNGNAEGMAEYPTAQYVGGFVGARGNFTEKLTGTIKGGYEYRWYQDDPRELSAPVVEVSLMERFTENTTLAVGYSRRVRESVQYVNSSYTSDAVSGSLVQNLGSDGRLRARVDTAYLSASYEENPAYVTGERKDQIVTAGLTISYDIKLWLRAFGSYDFEYLDSNEPAVVDYKVNRFTLGLQLGY
jgi:hypothetical protein